MSINLNNFSSSQDQCVSIQVLQDKMEDHESSFENIPRNLKQKFQDSVENKCFENSFSNTSSSSGISVPIPHGLSKLCKEYGKGMANVLEFAFADLAEKVSK